MYPFYFDKTYILIILGLVISMFAQGNIQRKFEKYRRVKTRNNITGLDTAKYILEKNNYTDISIKKVSGNLSDYFNPLKKEVRLSESSYSDTSIAAVAVAAHELGHVIQYEDGYIPLKIKSLIVPVVNFGSNLSIPLIFLGLFLSNQKFIYAGIILFSFVLIFQLITLPVEFNASKRALEVLESSQLLVGQENDYAAEMLRSAAFTYVAATISTSLQFLRLILLFGGRNNRRD